MSQASIASGPFDRLPGELPTDVREVVDRETPIPTIAQKAAAFASDRDDFVRGDIGQVSGFDPENEVLYGPPVGLEPLRTAVAEFWSLSFGLEKAGVTIGPANVAITSGAAEALALLFRCFGHGRVVGLPRGHWENYLNGVTLGGGEVEIIDYFDASGALDLDGIERQIRSRNIRCLVANFPCNPTGAVFDEDDARSLIEIARRHDVVILSDEVYARLRFDGRPPVSLLTYGPERVVVISSASKEYLLPGARVGYVLSTSATLTNKVLRKLIRANTASPNVLGQKEVLRRMTADLEDLRRGQEPTQMVRLRTELQRRQKALVEVLTRQGMEPVGRPQHQPAGTIFLMAALPDWWKQDDRAFAEAALEHGFSVIPGSSFAIPNSVRFSFGGMSADAMGHLERHLTKWREES